jgi:hypothetical protein
MQDRGADDVMVGELALELVYSARTYLLDAMRVARERST